MSGMLSGPPNEKPAWKSPSSRRRVLLAHHAICAETIRNTVRICESGPKGSDSRHLHLFDVDKHVVSNVSIYLPFDLWDPAFAGKEYFAALLCRINAAKRNHLKSDGIADDFLPNNDGEGAVYWTDKSGVVNVFWRDSNILKTLCLQSESDIRDFAESLFGEYDHSFETMRKLLDAHEGEWFDPPENFMYYSSYKAIQFHTVFFGVLPQVYQSDDQEGLKYYGRIVFTECKRDCSDVLNWTPIENKVWLRTNDQDYYGPFDNCSQAAIEMYRQFFKEE